MNFQRGGEEEKVCASLRLNRRTLLIVEANFAHYYERDDDVNIMQTLKKVERSLWLLPFFSSPGHELLICFSLSATKPVSSPSRLLLSGEERRQKRRRGGDLVSASVIFQEDNLITMFACGRPPRRLLCLLSFRLPFIASFL